MNKRAFRTVAGRHCYLTTSRRELHRVPEQVTNRLREPCLITFDDKGFVIDGD